MSGAGVFPWLRLGTRAAVENQSATQVASVCPLCPALRISKCSLTPGVQASHNPLVPVASSQPWGLVFPVGHPIYGLNFSVPQEGLSLYHLPLFLWVLFHSPYLFAFLLPTWLPVGLFYSLGYRSLSVSPHSHPQWRCILMSLWEVNSVSSYSTISVRVFCSLVLHPVFTQFLFIWGSVQCVVGVRKFGVYFKDV